MEPPTKQAARRGDPTMRDAARPAPDVDGFRDDRQSVWTLGEYLGGGAQGDVHRTHEAGYAIKLLAQADRSLHRVRRLPLGDLQIVAPQTYLEDGQGYTMELASDMEPLVASLLRPNLPPVFDQAWYRVTGGLAKRLAVATSVAETLGALHARGLVYGDLQLNNVMVSKRPRSTWTLLIDADNVDLEGEPTSILGTSGFIPPERLAEISSARLSQAQDRWALAVLVHRLLTADHPLSDGEERSPPQGRPQVPEPAAIGAVTAGTDWALSPALKMASHRSLTRGSQDPSLRVSARRWSSLLRRAERHIVECRCGWTQYEASMSCGACPREIRSEPRFSVWNGDRACAPLTSGRFRRRTSLTLGRHDLGSAEDVSVTVRHHRDQGRLEVTTRGCDHVPVVEGDARSVQVIGLRGPWSGERLVVIDLAT
jgi:serine/threonine protein kinase